LFVCGVCLLCRGVWQVPHFFLFSDSFESFISFFLFASSAPDMFSSGDHSASSTRAIGRSGLDAHGLCRGRSREKGPWTGRAIGLWTSSERGTVGSAVLCTSCWCGEATWTFRASVEPGGHGSAGTRPRGTGWSSQTLHTCASEGRRRRPGRARKCTRCLCGTHARCE
jgi:hypothetical protein